MKNGGNFFRHFLFYILKLIFIFPFRFISICTLSFHLSHRQCFKYLTPVHYAAAVAKRILPT